MRYYQDLGTYAAASAAASSCSCRSGFDLFSRKKSRRHQDHHATCAHHRHTFAPSAHNDGYQRAAHAYSVTFRNTRNLCIFLKICIELLHLSERSANVKNRVILCPVARTYCRILNAVLPGSWILHRLPAVETM